MIRTLIVRQGFMERVTVIVTSTVVIACYNGEKYIIEQLESIRKQTELPEEVIICDDCSSDNTYNTIRDYIKKYDLSKWMLIRNEENIGWKANFVKLIDLATKDIVFLCDQDDIWNANKIKVMKEILEHNPDIDLLVSDLDVVYMSDNMQPYKCSYLGLRHYQHLSSKAKWLRIRRPGCVFSVRRSFAQECFRNICDHKTAHDVILWQCAFIKNKIGYVKERLVKYRRLGDSVTYEVYKSKLEYRIMENSLFLEGLEKVMNAFPCENKKIEKIVRRCYNLERERKKLYQTKSIITWFKCLRYLDCYPYKRSWIVDMFVK